ncbi:MAG TPA: hypothetical protein H9774_04805 [Candidatus Desulfovibrio gallistercoris]|nr:hypothetical protein [Candidatus Desulfovibrio gallistercoris]
MTVGPASWLPGVCRGLTATAGGHVRAADCRATRWWRRLEGHRGSHMRREEAAAMVEHLEAMYRELEDMIQRKGD